MIVQIILWYNPDPNVKGLYLSDNADDIGKYWAKPMFHRTFDIVHPHEDLFYKGAWHFNAEFLYDQLVKAERPTEKEFLITQMLTACETIFAQ